MSDSKAAAARLCTDCGLCCNGALFDRVNLQPDDRARTLVALGLRIKKGAFFNQPCRALCGTQCTIYEARPQRCRAFECRQYREVVSGETPEETARERIRDARCQLAAVEALLISMDGNNPRKPVAQRCATVNAEIPKPETPARLGELEAAMKALKATLNTYFRV